uniref:Sporulation protein YjcZ n=1 Tax=Anaerobacillus isosaccharinicus TaxID=1532552 RepID=A0A7S7LDJ4_9BACI|nr:sporulation protein YjcZ [Anaerobacillus isosaccharinicus]MBA5586248.1 sporulation protein YjcZ [Anaerobacillus isosaccharinicus]QOY38726.1 sporulation protein YjcZ [Anaerobacillus isosaccharinicus]
MPAYPAGYGRGGGFWVALFVVVIILLLILGAVYLYQSPTATV